MNERLCADCDRPFVVGRDQAARYAARGWAPPRRCPACRTKRRAQAGEPAEPIDAPPPAPKPPAPPPRPASARLPATPVVAAPPLPEPDYELEDPPDVPPEIPPRSSPDPDAGPSFDVQCAACGAGTRVPFKPTGKRPVYCRECYELR